MKDNTKKTLYVIELGRKLKSFANTSLTIKEDDGTTHPRTLGDCLLGPLAGYRSPGNKQKELIAYNLGFKVYENRAMPIEVDRRELGILIEANDLNTGFGVIVSQQVRDLLENAPESHEKCADGSGLRKKVFKCATRDNEQEVPIFVPWAKCYSYDQKMENATGAELFKTLQKCPNCQRESLKSSTGEKAIHCTDCGFQYSGESELEKEYAFYCKKCVRSYTNPRVERECPECGNKETSEEAHPCPSCKADWAKGEVRDSCIECGARMFEHKNYMKSQMKNTCPSCSADWGKMEISTSCGRCDGYYHVKRLGESRSIKTCLKCQKSYVTENSDDGCPVCGPVRGIEITDEEIEYINSNEPSIPNETTPSGGGAE